MQFLGQWDNSTWVETQMMLMRVIRTCWCSQDPDTFQQVEKTCANKILLLKMEDICLAM